MLLRAASRAVSSAGGAHRCQDQIRCQEAPLMPWKTHHHFSHFHLCSGVRFTVFFLICDKPFASHHNLEEVGSVVPTV